MKSSTKKFAVFDIDGTLFRWQLFHELVEELVRSGAISDGDELAKSWDGWRGGELSFEDYEHHLIKDILYKNLTKIPVGTFEQACETVVKNSSHKVHRYTHKLLRDLKAKGYEIIAISGSQQELLDRFCARYDFDVAIGAMYERKDGYFTGQISRMTVGNKAMILRKLINARNLSLDQSIAIGDSDGDIDILALVEQPIAFNPSQGLFDHAKAAGWPIVIERKNMAYKLEGKDGRLVLAEAIAL